MPTQQSLDDTYMGTAMLHARLSKALRAKVGAVLVTQQGVTLTGYNGTPTGFSNYCENFVVQEKGKPDLLVTKPEVVHAELNCVLKAAKEGVSCLNSTIYVTLMPCVPCSAMLIQAGIKELVYKDLYRDTQGIDLLQKAGILVRKYKEKEESCQQTTQSLFS